MADKTSYYSNGSGRPHRVTAQMDPRIRQLEVGANVHFVY